MATEVLHPHDCLPHRLRPGPSTSSSPAFFSRRKPYRGTHMHPHTNNPNANPRINHLLNDYHFNANSSPNPRPCRKAMAKKRREVATGTPSPQSLVMGQVSILKRGESLDEKTSGYLSNEKRSDTGGVLSSKGGGDLIVAERNLQIPVPGVYAGAACSVSPSPSALPLPTFPIKKRPQLCAAQAATSVDLSATEDLRRILRLA